MTKRSSLFLGVFACCSFQLIAHPLASIEKEKKDPVYPCIPCEKKPPMRACLSKAGRRGFDMTAELLYWQPSEGGTEFAVEYDTSIGELGNGKSHSIDFSYQLGMRYGLGYHMPYDHWKMDAIFTYFHGTANQRVNGTLFPTYILHRSSGVSSVTEATSNWKVYFSSLDVQLGREQTFGRSLLWTPFIGAKAARIHQRFNYGYSGGAAISSGNTYTAITTNKFNGAGLSAGVNGEWFLGRGIRFLGSCSAALVYGYFNILQRQNQENVEQVYLPCRNYQFSPTTDIKLALGWGDSFRNRKGYLGISVGYEAQYWWRQNQMPQFFGAQQPTYFRVSEDLGFQGLTGSIYINF